MLDVHGPAEGSIEAQVTALAELQQEGLVRHIGLSNVTTALELPDDALEKLEGVAAPSGGA